MGFKKSLKALALVSSLFFAVSTMSCSASYIVKKYGPVSMYKDELKKPKNKYAILISGTLPTLSDRGLERKVAKVYDGIKELGFSDENIYFLASHKTERTGKFVDYIFTNHNFKKVCSELSEKMTEDDMLLLFYIGHGGNNDKDIYLFVKNKDDPDDPDKDVFFYLKDLHEGLEKLRYGYDEGLEKLRYDYAVFVIDTCMSGTPAKLLSKKSTVIVSSTKENENNYTMSHFSKYLIEALNGKKDADKNNDGKVSLEEAVYYATEKDPWSKKYKGIKSWFPEPQIYYEDIDPSKIFLKE